jgi:poly-gamma-glutamate synthesis protein (capsule biosynthesis protein)
VSVSLLSQNGDREAYIQNGIAQLREQGAAIVIACCHWGIEGDHYPNDYQQAAAHRIIDWGADLVVGNHPHVLQGMEVYNGKMICYSLGNFCFGGNKNPADKNTAIYQQAFTLINGELQPGIDAQIIPCTLSSVSSYNDFRPTVASGEKAQEICNLMNTYSQNYSKIEIDELGKLHVN